MTLSGFATDVFAEIHVERGRIKAILPCEIGTIVRTETRTYQFPGCSIYPGFVDNHAHIVGLGTKLSVVSLHDCKSEQQCVDRLLAAAVPESGWLHAMGWNQENWDVKSFPSGSTLNTAFPDVPVSASRVDGHAMWVNAAAERIAGTTSALGILIDAEMDAIWNVIPKPSSQEVKDRILLAAAECSSKGITEVHDMDVHPEWLPEFTALALEGALPIRVQSFVQAQHSEWDRDGILPAGGELHRIIGVKYYADGALGSRGAWLLSPYADAPGSDGIRLMDKETLLNNIRLAVDAGWTSVAVHAIGCAANRLVLDAYAEVRQWPDGRDLLLRIEHAQHVHPDDVSRFAELSVFACIQPSHCISDAVMAEHRLDSARLPWAYRWNSLISNGVKIGAGSDFPIEPPSPLQGIHAFVNRVPSGKNSSWNSEERLTVAEALHAFTAGAHATADMDYRRGQIEVGFDADIVVLNADLMKCDIEGIDDIQVMATFVAGRLRYSV